jgi:uncharacterized protein YdeI (YjbR/CyaY-like superfamily)
MDLLKAKDRSAWRSWLKENSSREREVWLVFYKEHSEKVSVSYDDAVEEALCFGWIDSMIRRVDEDSYAQKFTPRKPNSRWSTSNLTRIQRLIENGSVSEGGMDAYERRSSEAPAGETIRDPLLAIPRPRSPPESERTSVAELPKLLALSQE